MSSTPRSISEISQENLAKIQVVFFDIDDTFSLHGKIPAVAYDALWAMQRAGLLLVPVTGRPAGWCDMIARMWPVTAVVGENGAFYMKMEKGKLNKIYLEKESIRSSNANKLLQLKAKLIKKFKNLQFASDQLYREFDLALDYCEDVKPWSAKKVDELIAYCREQGAIAKLSSIHVNTWYGRYDKLTCVQKFIKEQTKLSAKNWQDSCVYLGDSPNDEPFFKAFRWSIGVANVRAFLSKLDSPPAFITPAEGGEGFAQFAQRLIAARQK